MSVAQPPTDPNIRTVDYALAPGALDEDVDVQSEEMLVNMGPQHPSTHGVLRIVLRTDGEMVLEAVPHLGYLHRCKEKIAENLAYYQYIGYTDRLDYLAAMNNNHAWSMAVEKLADIEVPQRAEYIRVIAVGAEPHRVAPGQLRHVRPGHGRVHAVPLRLPRARVHPRPVRAALRRPADAQLHQRRRRARGTCRRCSSRSSTEFLDYFEPKIDEYNDLLSFNHIFVKRTANVGVVHRRSSASATPCRGPMIRGSGIPLDLRRDRPYSVYDRARVRRLRRRPA